MKILAIEPYYGGSHKAFIDGWMKVSEHQWTLLTLPAYKWKWRMRHSAVTMADEVSQRIKEGGNWDLFFCTDMLNLAEFIGLSSAQVQQLPKVVYFHENQLTYPVRFESERDYQFAMTNMTTALAAEQMWFNSAFHRDSFLEAVEVFLRKMPDYNDTEVVEKIKCKSGVYPPGINEFPKRAERKPGPLRILWCARWEHDKNPEDFFSALKAVKESGVDFRLSVIGEQFRDEPAVFGWAKDFFSEHIERWGYQQSRDEYEQVLCNADVVVSTANHEFFGISIVEAISAGAYPILPKRLAYPEILALGEAEDAEEFFYDGTVRQLEQKLILLAKLAGQNNLPDNSEKTARLTEGFKWENAGREMDKGLNAILKEKASS